MITRAMIEAWAKANPGSYLSTLLEATERYRPEWVRFYIAPTSGCSTVGVITYEVKRPNA